MDNLDQLPYLMFVCHMYVCMYGFNVILEHCVIVIVLVCSRSLEYSSCQSGQQHGSE